MNRASNSYEYVVIVNANKMHPLNRGGGAQTEKIQKQIEENFIMLFFKQN